MSLRGVWLSYPRGRRHVVRVLMDVSLEVHAGEVVAVLARRAQGKTSLLRVAAGMERPDRGSVCFAGEDMWRSASARGRRRWRRATASSAPIALVRAAPPDMDIPVGEGVALPLTGAHTWRGARELAERALEEAGVGECASRHWSDLSDGERARVAIAQGIAREPKLLLVDDLTATLDLAETEEVAMLLYTLAAARGLGVLMGVGDAGAAKWSERVATLAAGELLLGPASRPGPAGEHPERLQPPGQPVRRLEMMIFCLPY